MYGNHRQILINNGFLPIPITPREKYPAIKNWTSGKSPTGYDNHGVGILCGAGKHPVIGLDIDVLDESLAKEILDMALMVAGETIYRVGKPPKTMLVYRTETPGRKQKSIVYNCGHIEVLNSGQQFVALGIHPATGKPYTWPGYLGSIADVKATDLPIIRDETINKIVSMFQEKATVAGFSPVEPVKTTPQIIDDFDPLDPLDQIPPLGKSVAELKQMLDGLNPDCSREQWRNIGMALHHELSGSAEGLKLWDAWSSKGIKYRPGEPDNQWQSFGKYTGRPITAAYLLKLTKPQQTPAEPEGDKTFFERLNWGVDRFHDDPPELPLLIDTVLPCGIVSLLYSAGGAGKSTLLLNMCAKIALAESHEITFFGRTIYGGSAVIVTAEDPELILNRRYIGICKALSEEINIDFADVKKALQKNLFIVSTFGRATQLFTIKPDGTLGPTTIYSSLLNCLKAIENLKITVIDTKTRYSPGEGQGNVLATQEISYYEAIARHTDAVVMLSHHSNKASRSGLVSGLQAYRDASAIYDSVRAVWFLRPLSSDEMISQGVKEEDQHKYMVFENCKNNYIEMHSPIVLRRDGYAYTHEQMAPKLTKAEREVKEYERSVTLLLEALDAAEGDEWSKADIKRLCKRKGLGIRRTETAIEETLAAGLIERISSDGVRGVAYIYKMTDAGRAALKAEGAFND